MGSIAVCGKPDATISETKAMEDAPDRPYDDADVFSELAEETGRRLSRQLSPAARGALLRLRARLHVSAGDRHLATPPGPEA